MKYAQCHPREEFYLSSFPRTCAVQMQRDQSDQIISLLLQGPAICQDCPPLVQNPLYAFLKRKTLLTNNVSILDLPNRRTWWEMPGRKSRRLRLFINHTNGHTQTLRPSEDWQRASQTNPTAWKPPLPQATSAKAEDLHPTWDILCKPWGLLPVQPPQISRERSCQFQSPQEPGGSALWCGRGVLCTCRRRGGSKQMQRLLWGRVSAL